jgi:hypothetical protein
MRIKSITFISFLLVLVLLPLSLRAQKKPLPHLLTTKEEVVQFFGAYADRYIQKDVNGFLSLFSSKAIQNQKDGLEGIRTDYTNFFDRSLTLLFRMEEMNMEIYQNAVEVRGHYQIDQILNKSGEKKILKGNIRWVLGKENGVLKILSLDYQNDKGGGQ